MKFSNPGPKRAAIRTIPRIILRSQSNRSQRKETMDRFWFMLDTSFLETLMFETAYDEVCQLQGKRDSREHETAVRFGYKVNLRTSTNTTSVHNFAFLGFSQSSLWRVAESVAVRLSSMHHQRMDERGDGKAKRHDRDATFLTINTINRSIEPLIIRDSFLQPQKFPLNAVRLQFVC